MIPSRLPDGRRANRSQPTSCSTGSKLVGAGWGRRRSTRILSALRRILADAERDPAFAAEALTLPSEAFLADQVAVVDVDAIHAARESARVELGRALSMELASAYVVLTDPGPYQIDGMAIGRRALRKTCLAYLSRVAADRGA